MKGAFAGAGDRTTVLAVVLTVALCLSSAGSVFAQTASFTAGELLGKPTDTSVTFNIVPASAIQYGIEYGTEPGVYTDQIDVVDVGAGEVSEVTIEGLSPNTRYYYRMVYDADGSITDGDYETRAEHSFWTQRAAGEGFAFTVTSDIHNNLSTNEQNVMTHILSEAPDFEVDLGDTFMTGDAGITSQSAANTRYVNQRGSSYFGKIGPSVPVFLATGNHEDEEGWNLDDTGTNATGLWNIAARKTYFPLPSDERPDGFYSGNVDPLAAALGGDTNREDYYAWRWGDALFVVIDEFQYTMNLPYAPAAGERSDDSSTGDQWSWTLGDDQYEWLTQVLEGSDARYKFVFSHNMLGGIPNKAISGAGAGYVRGGAEAAGYFEWGGKNADGSPGFAAHRPDWDKTIHQLFVDNGVSAYFHGHDHQYCYETRDGVVYQEVPSGGGMGGFSGIYSEGDHGDFETIEQQLSGNGHLRVRVESDHATVDYVSASSGSINHTYDIEPSVVSTEPAIDVVGSLAAFSSQPGLPSVARSYTVSGRNLTDDIHIAAPADFEVSETGTGGWASSLTLPESGGVVTSTPVYVRFRRANEGTSSGSIVHSSAGATTRNLPVTGTATVPTIDIADAIVAPIPDKTYTGSAITPTVTVTLEATTLVSGADYTLGYANNTSVGTATVTVTGIGDYQGSTSATFKITKATPSVTWPSASAITLGHALSASVLTGGTHSVPGTYAFVTPSFVPLATGPYSALLTFNPSDAANYNAVGGTVEVQVDPPPTATDIASAIVAPIADRTYTGAAITPTVTVTMGAEALIEGVDYTLGYANNTNAGTAMVTVAGIGDFFGTKTATFTILKATPSVITWPSASPIVLGQALSASALNGGVHSVLGTFAFATPSFVPLAPGPCGALVTFTPTDAANYDSVSGTVTVQVVPVPDPVDIASATVAPIPDKTYTGAAITPAVTVTLGPDTLVAGEDYTLAYANNTYAGKATVIVTGIGDYDGTTSATFHIVPKQTAISKLTAGTHKFTVSWTKHSHSGGYQVAYSRYKTKGFKYAPVTTKSSKTVSKLKTGVRYYVKVRAYKTIDGIRCCGKWSTLKSVKVQ